jgi:hypothetical protein
VIGFGAAVALFRSAHGAHAALADRIAGCRNKTFTIIGLGGHRPVGPDTLVCTRGKRLGDARVRIFVVQWRNGRATGSVYVSAFEGAVTPVAALTGARKQNRRMTAEFHAGQVPWSKDDRAEGVPLELESPLASARDRTGASQHRSRKCASHGRGEASPVQPTRSEPR